MTMVKVVDTTSEEFELVRQSNPVVYNIFEKLYRQEVTAEGAFATLAVLMSAHVEHLQKELKTTLDQSPRLFANLKQIMTGGAE